MLCALSAQQYNYPINNYHQTYLELGQSRMDSVTLTGLRALPESWMRLDSVWGYEPVPPKMYSAFSAAILRDHHVTIEKEELKLYIDFLINFELGTEQRKETAYADTTRFSRNMRGFSVKGELGKKVSFETTFREDQTTYPWYLLNRIRNSVFANDGASGVAPGGGRIKFNSIKGADNSIAEGYISYSPVKAVNIQFGHQKNFIGSGYRSLLLSDNAYTYPQLKMTGRFMKNRLYYQSIMGSMSGLRRLPMGDTPEALFRRKGVSFHYLEFRPHKRVSLGLFEAVVWQRFDVEVGTVPNPVERYVPLLGLNTALNGLESTHNSIIGLDLGVKINRGIQLFGQYVMDAEDQTGYQVGIKTADLFVRNLRVQAEYNSVDPFTYAHPLSLQSYTHLNQGIAHPRGAGVNEASIGVMYLYDRWFADIRYTAGDQLLDLPDSTNIGSNVNLPEDFEGTFEPQTRSQSNYVLTKLGYMLNSKSNFNFYVSWLYRDETGPLTYGNNSLISFGLSMNMHNRYEDL